MAVTGTDCQGAGGVIIAAHMNDKVDRSARRAQQLRDNLRKRKAQARKQALPLSPERQQKED